MTLLPYGELVAAVAKFLGYDPAHLTETMSSEVDGCVQSGLRNYYYPPKMEGVDEGFEWAFLRREETLETQAGVGDYALPASFGRIFGQLTPTDCPAPGVPVIPYGDLVRMRSDCAPSRPRFVALSATGTGKHLHLCPVPDKAYRFAYTSEANIAPLSASNEYALGDDRNAELLLESCLAAAEQRVNDETGQHCAAFNRLLVAAIERERKAYAQTFGYIGDAEAIRW